MCKLFRALAGPAVTWTTDIVTGAAVGLPADALCAATCRADVAPLLAARSWWRRPNAVEAGKFDAAMTAAAYRQRGHDDGSFGFDTTTFRAPAADARVRVDACATPAAGDWYSW